MSRVDAEDYQLRWHAFLVDGFEDWLPLATVASAQMTKTTPRQVLQWMISDFYYPDGVQQSDADLTAKVEGIAYAFNAVRIDPKTGERIGRMRDSEGIQRRNQKAAAERQLDPVRKRKAEQRAARAAARKKG